MKLQPPFPTTWEFCFLLNQRSLAALLGHRFFFIINHSWVYIWKVTEDPGNVTQWENKCPASSIQQLIPSTTKRRGEKAENLKETERETNQLKCSHESLLVPLAFSLLAQLLPLG